MSITSKPFGATKQGKPVTRFELTNRAGMAVHILDYAGTIQSILIPEKNGSFTDVALGYDDMISYQNGSCYFGKLVGRYANRIRGAAFELNNRRYELEKNDGNNHLHGVFCDSMFDAAVSDSELVLSQTFPDMAEGYPGTLNVTVKYSLSDDNTLSIEYFAKTDADTVINLTNHAYFNLNGTGDILNHTLCLKADRFTEADNETLPTGRILQTEGTPMDFRTAKEIGRDIKSSYSQITQSRGYDANYILNDSTDGITGEDIPSGFAYARGDISGIMLRCATTQPAVQFYSGNFVDDDTAVFGKGGVRYPRYAGFCLETQNYPCAPNEPSFPNCVLKPGQVYHHITEYSFEW